MKKQITIKDAKTWVKNHKKQLIIGGSIAGGTLAVIFAGKKLLDNDKISVELCKWLLGHRIERHGYCCSVVAAFENTHVSVDQGQAIVDNATAAFEEIYRAAGAIK